MYEIHTTRDGEQMMICCMKDSHLYNTIKLMLNRIRLCRELLFSQQADDAMVSVFQPEHSLAAARDRAKSEMQRMHQKIQPYIMEAALRGWKLGDLMSAAYGRSKSVPMRPIALPSADDYEAEWDESIDDSEH